MEVKEKSKKRELIKTIAIVFLAVLLVLTFFSNTIMNRSLAEVSTTLVTSGTINARIRGSGTVSANESYEVVLDQTREVRSVCVKVGDTVNQGDLLFVLGDVESQELKDAQEQLQTLNINYQKQLLELSKGYAADDLTVKTLREDLEKAQADRDANAVTDAEISYAKGDLAAAKTELSQLELMLSELNDALADDPALQEAQAAVTEWTQKVSTAQTAVDTYQQQLDELESGGSVDLDRQIADAKTALEKAKNTWRSDWLAYRSDLGALIAEIKSETSYAVTDINTSTDTPQEISGNNQVYIEAYLTQYVLPLPPPAVEQARRAGQPGRRFRPLIRLKEICRTIRPPMTPFWRPKTMWRLSRQPMTGWLPTRTSPPAAPASSAGLSRVSWTTRKASCAPPSGSCGTRRTPWRTPRRTTPI